MLKAYIEILTSFWGLIISLFSSIIELFTDKFGRLNFFGFILYPYIIMTIIELVLDIVFEARDTYVDFFSNDDSEEDLRPVIINPPPIKKDDILEAEITEKKEKNNE